MTKAAIITLTESTTNVEAMVDLNSNFSSLDSQLPSDADWAIVSVTGTQTLENKTLTNPTVSTGTFTSPTLITPALGTPTSGVATNLTGTATGLTSGITNGLKSATTTVSVSAATAPTSWQALVATSSTTATWQSPDRAYWDFAIKLGSDFTVTNSSTLTDVTGFTFASVAGEVWDIVLMGSCTANDSTWDIKAELVTTGTWTAANSYALGQYYNASAALTSLASTIFPSSTTAIGSLVINNGDAVVRPFNFEFKTVVATNWNIKFQIANVSASGGRTSTIKAWTYMLARKLST